MRIVLETIGLSRRHRHSVRIGHLKITLRDPSLEEKTVRLSLIYRAEVEGRAKLGIKTLGGGELSRSQKSGSGGNGRIARRCWGRDKAHRTSVDAGRNEGIKIKAMKHLFDVLQVKVISI